MTYSYRIKSHPLVDEDLHALISNQKTIGYEAKIGEQLNVNEFFEVLDVNNNLVGYIWFIFYSDDSEIEINIGKSPAAQKFQGFAKQIFSDLDKFRIELPAEWFNEHSKWLSIVKNSNPHKIKLESLLISNGFEKDGEDGFLKEINMPNHMTTNHETFLYYLNSIAASSNENPISSNNLFLGYLPDGALEPEISVIKQGHDGIIQMLTHDGFVKYQITENDILITGFTADGEKLRDTYNSISRI